MKVAREDIDSLPELVPPRDEEFSRRLEQVVQGKLGLYFAAIPRVLIRPFDSNYLPSRHPVGEAAIQQVMTDWRAGEFHRVWLYPKNDAYILSDDYVVWEAVERGQPDYLPCYVLGYPSLEGAKSIQGPIAADDVRRLLGLESQ